MNVLIYLYSLSGGGAERVSANLANHWAARGWSVTIVTITPVSEDFYALHPAVRRESLGLSARSNRFVDAAVRNVARILALRRLIRKIGPDVAVAMMTNASVVLSLACRGLPGIIAIGSERTYPGQVTLDPMWSLLRRTQYRRLHAVVAQTTECAQWLMQHTSTARAPAIPNSVSLPLAVKSPVISPDAICKPGRTILLAAGRLVDEKNFSLLIDVFKRLAAAHPGWDLVILGEGPLDKALRKQADDCGLGERVLLPGLAGNPGAWYARADLYVMSSRFEGFPNTLLEALAHGVPGVSFDCDTGPRDIIRHGTDGLLIPANDAQAMHQGLDKLMGDDAYRGQLAMRAGDARDRFSIERVAGMWECLFMNAVAVPRHAVHGDGSAPTLWGKDT